MIVCVLISKKKKKKKRKKKKKVCYYIVIKSNYKGGNCIIPLNRIISCFLFRLCLLIVNFPILGNCDVYVTYIYIVYYSNLIIFILYLYLIIRVNKRILFEMSLCICILVRRVNENSYFSWRNSLIVAGGIV